MPFKFEKIAQAVCKQLDQIIMEEDDEERGFITAKDFMNDFATDDFLSKNIRVRPISGGNRGADHDETRTMADPNMPSRLGGAVDTNENEKTDKDFEYEMTQERE